jgi:baculoviral IAP repeat-containing protein 7/8
LYPVTQSDIRRYKRNWHSHGCFTTVVTCNVMASLSGDVEVPTKCKDYFTRPEFESKMVHMRSGPHRLETFRTKKKLWPHSFIPPEILAEAGLFYLMKGDKVMCAFCRNVFFDWHPWHEPLVEHARHYPTCPFIMEEFVGNIPIVRDPMRVIGQDVCGNHTFDGRETCKPKEIPVMVAIHKRVLKQRTSIVLDYYGIQPRYRAKYPQYASLATRRESFLKLTEHAEKASDAGFFFDDDDQAVKCYYCGDQLRDLLQGNPWQKHCLQSPDCGNVIQERGKAFIQAMREDCSTQMENLELDQSAPSQSTRLCIMCSRYPIGVAFLPCGDAIACKQCSDAVIVCPVCEVDLNGVVLITLP